MRVKTLKIFLLFSVLSCFLFSQVKLKKKIIYDVVGNKALLNRIDSFDVNGRLLSSALFAGHLFMDTSQQKESQSGSRRLQVILRYKYDVSGKLSEEFSEYPNGRTTSSLFYERTDSSVTAVSYLPDSGTKKKEWLIVFNPLGDTTCYLRFDENDSVANFGNYYVLKYDTKNRLIDKKKYVLSNPKKKTWIATNYREHLYRNPITSKIDSSKFYKLDSDSVVYGSYASYDSRSRPLTIISKNKSGRVLSIINYCYKGDYLVKVEVNISGMNRESTYFSYDKYGRVSLRKRISEGKVIEEKRFKYTNY